MNPLSDWQPGQAVTAAKLNEPVRALREIVAAGGNVLRMDAGRSASVVAQFTAVVVAAGPAGEPEVTAGPQYWVRATSLRASAAREPIKVAGLKADLVGNVVLATNRAETVVAPDDGTAATGTHALPVGTEVHVFVSLDANATPHHWFFSGGVGGGLTVVGRITASSAIVGTFNRWRYAWKEVRKLEDGIWEDVPGGRTSATAGYGYNATEDMNGETGVQGNGINVDLLPPGATLLPAPVGLVRRLTPSINCNAVVEWDFEYENGVSDLSECD